MKFYSNGLQKGYKSDDYMVQNLTWSGVYLRINLSYALLQKVLRLVPMTSTRPKFFVSTMTTVLSCYYSSLEETLKHFNSIIIKYHPGWNIEDWCATILVDNERLKVPEHLNPSTLNKSIAPLRTILILYFISRKLISTRRLHFLLRNLVYVRRVVYDLIISLNMGPLLKRIYANSVESNQGEYTDIN